LTAEDLAFLVDTLARRPSDHDPLRDLASDPDALDRLLDSPVLFQGLLEAPRLLHVSPWFFYYVVVRRTFLDHGIDHRVAADYVGALLSYHLQRWETGAHTSGETVYLVDLVRAMTDARSAEEEFALKAEVGNLALYLAGLFPDWVYHRSIYGHRPVGIEYYEDMGRRYYAAAARTEAAQRHALGDVLEYMAARFPALRQALNDLVDEHLHLAPRPTSVDSLCRQALYRVRN
jgi:hypothetical protein